MARSAEVNRNHSSIWLKFKVFGIYAVLTVAVGVAISMLYDSVNTLNEQVDLLSTPNPRLQLLNRTLALITQAENQARRLAIQPDDVTMGTYLAYQDSIQSDLKELMQLTDSTKERSQHRQLRQVVDLMVSKQENLDRLLALSSDVGQYDNFSQVLEKAEEESTKPDNPKKANPPAPAALKFDPINQVSLPLLFRKYRKPVLQYLQSYLSKENGKSAEDKDDAVNMDELKNIISTVKAERESSVQLLNVQEIKLLQQNTEIAERIRFIISRLEQSELQRDRKSLKAIEDIIDGSLKKFLLITLFAVSLGLVFMAVIFRDITRASRLRTQLVIEREKAEALSKAKEEFLANMSHEIRTPLNAVQGFTQQLLGTHLSQQQQEYLGAVKSASEHLLNTVNDILDFSKIEAGKLSIEQIPFRMDWVVREVIHAMRFKAEEKGLELSAVYEGETETWLVGDPFRMKQILFNLIGNALKFTEEGFVEVVCTIESSASNGVMQCDLAVNDTGIGIPADKLPLIFKDFSQADASTTRKYGGTGLGLSISQRLASLQGGRISVESNMGEGSTFTVSIPYAIAPPEVIPQDAGPGKPLPIAQLQGRRILLVDDDPLNIRLAEVIFQKYNLTSVAVYRAQEALQVLESQSFDLLMTDIQMPGMSGLQLTEAIRRSGKPFAQLPVVAFTANVMKDDLERYRKAGIDNFLLKPFKEEDLLRKIAEVLKINLLTGQLPKSEAATPQQKGAQEPIYSLNRFKGFAGRDAQLLADLVRSFLQQNRQDLDLLNKWVVAKNWVETERLAHKMLNSYAGIEAQQPANWLRQLEQIRQFGLTEAQVEELAHSLQTYSHETLFPALEAEISR